MLPWLVASLVLPVVAPVREPAITDEDRAHWSFVAPKRPAVPADTHPIDALIRAKLGKLSPSPEADRRTLIRRVSFDLIGLPPTPAELNAFLADTSPDAYAKLVDRLLASPHYGERQAQHWLDAVRFAETNGYELDADRPHAWRYRDYVVRSLNADKPYDRFLTEQLAGDELAAGQDPKSAPDLLIATGMHRCGPTHVVVGTDPAALRQENLTEMVNGVGSAVLGLTVACARCHDHKFDPISAADFYRLQAFFAGTQYKDVNLAPKAERDRYAGTVERVAKQVAPLRKQIDAMEEPYRVRLKAEKVKQLEPENRAAFETAPPKRTPAQQKIVKDLAPVVRPSWDEVLEALTPDDRATRTAWVREIERLEEAIPAPPAKAWAAVHEDERPTYLLKRGDVASKGGLLGKGFPRVLASATAAPRSRLELAQWLTAKDHPLTARVMVNRLWQRHFGYGLVRTPNDFGIKGDLPTHPELLDWLAREFMEPSDGGAPWGLKRMHRLIVLSATYRQASDPKPGDPENRLLSRQSRKRLDAEAIRDAVLAAAGTLNRAVGGASVRVPLEPEVYDLIFTEGEPTGLWKVDADPRQHVRRSIYLFAKRNVRLPILEAFDQPDTLTPCANRGLSTYAPQALILMNGPFSHEQAGRLAATLVADGTPAEWTTALYERAFARKPSPAERRIAATFLASQTQRLREKLRAEEFVAVPPNLPTTADPAQAAALMDLCLAVFNANEFVYIR